MRGTAITVVVLAALVLCAELHAIPAGYWMTDLGPGAAYAINNSGQVVGIRPFPNRPQWQAFLWDNGVFTNLDTLGYHSWAYDINESGQVVGHIFKTVGPNISFLYDNGVTRSLEIWEDDHDSSAVGINDQGEITGWVSVGGTRGYRLDEQGYTELEDLRPADIGPDGCIVGKTVEWTNRLERAFTWQDNVVTILPTLAGESGARSINSEAQIVGFSEDAEENRHPVLWDNGVMENLYPVAGTEAGAFDINESGQVVGTLRMGSGPWSAFIWDNGTVYELNNLITESRYTLTGGAAINDLGQIVCQAWDTEREDYVIALLNPIPEPATLSLIAMGFIGLICRARRMNGRTRTTREQGGQTMKRAIVFIIVVGFLSAAHQAGAVEYVFTRAVGSMGTGDGQFNSPFGVDVDSSGNVWVADAGNDRIQQFDSTGTFIQTFGSRGSTNGRFNDPWGVAVDWEGKVWVADRLNHRIQKFNGLGGYIRQVGGQGTANGQFDHPPDVAVDSTGNVWVADTVNQRIQEFTNVGVFLQSFGSPGTGDGQFANPRSLAVDTFGNVWVADSGNDRVHKFSGTGEFILALGGYGSGEGQFDTPCGVAVDLSGNVWVADTFNDRIQVFDSGGNFLMQLGEYGSGEGQFYAPRGVALDSLGNVWIADTGNKRIQEFSPIPEPATLSLLVVGAACAVGRSLRRRRSARGGSG